MRLATWNINSMRLRIDLVTGFLRDHDIDVLCKEVQGLQADEPPNNSKGLIRRGEGIRKLYAEPTEAVSHRCAVAL